MSVRVRLRFTKSLLRRSERLCFAFGFACLGWCTAAVAHVWLFQAYEKAGLSSSSSAVNQFRFENSWCTPQHFPEPGCAS